MAFEDTMNPFLKNFRCLFVLVLLGILSGSAQPVSQELQRAVKEGDVSKLHRLLDGGSGSVDATLLIDAAYYGHAPVARLLMDRGVSPNATNRVGWTPLLSAARRGDLEVVNALLSAGAAPSLAAKDGSTPLLVAAEAGHTEVIQALVSKGASVNERYPNTGLVLGRPRIYPQAFAKQYPYGNSALHLAVLNNQSNTVRLLLELGANIEEPDASGNTALLLAVGDSLKGIAQELLDRGANPNVKNMRHETPLTLAIRQRDLRLIEMLIAGGADPNQRLFQNWTPFVVAVSTGDTNLVGALLERGANITLIDQHGRSLFEKPGAVSSNMLAFLDRNAGTPSVRTQLARLRSVKAAKAASAMLRGVSLAERTKLNQRLCEAARAGDLSGVKNLLAGRANPNAKNQFEWPALLLATDKGHVAIVKTLLNSRAMVDQQGRGGWTALMLAAKNGNFELVRLLVEQGACVYSRNSAGVHVIDIAGRRQHTNIVSFLEEKGAKRAAPQILISAAYENNLGLLRLLLDDNELGSYYSRYVSDALLVAARYGRKEVAELLLDHGADINYADPSPPRATEAGRTPLLAALSDDRWPEMVEFLIERGADVNKTDLGGMTPLHSVRVHDGRTMEHLTKLLKEAGAKE